MRGALNMSSFRGLLGRLEGPLTVLLLAVVPALSIPVLAVGLVHSHNFAFDFDGWYWWAGHRILAGVSPYTFGVEHSFNYPAFGGLLFVPFAALPRAVADGAFTACVVASVPVALRTLGVRDWRVYGIAFLWPPVVYGWETANVSLLLVLGVAVAWRFRDRAAIAGTALAVVISVKLFLVPLLVWLLATRRYAALATAGVVGAVLSAGAWLIVGSHELAQYTHTLSLFAATAEHRGYSLVALCLQEGISRTAAYAAAVTLAGAAVVAALRFGWQRRGGPASDRLALAACIGTSLIGSPVMECHYLSLLLVPLALARPRLSGVWALPLVLWVAPVDHPAAWQRVLALAVGAAVFAAATRQKCRPRPGQRVSRRAARAQPAASG
jgi:hypothetical protein